MNNYDVMLADAQRRFTGYDMDALARKSGVSKEDGFLCTSFLGQPAQVEKATGQVWVAGLPGDFGQTLSVLDWLCDRKEDAVAAEEFCPVSSLPGVYVSGSGLNMAMPRVAEKIHQDPRWFSSVIEKLGGKREPLGDIGCRLPLFPDLPMCLKFYFGDEEFPPSLTLLWDKNILRFVRYETVYYIAGCLQKLLLEL